MAHKASFRRFEQAQDSVADKGVENGAEPPPSTPRPAELARYIADMSAELAGLAASSRMTMLAYFLNLARVEAEILARENDAAPPRRQSRSVRD